jgi:hypothetical protein
VDPGSPQSAHAGRQFFSALRHESLVLLNLKDLPLVEDRVPGEPHLVGAGFVTGVDLVVELDLRRFSGATCAP